MKVITKIRERAFKVTTQGVSEGQLILDFNPLIDRFQLTGNYKLIHWQARPKKHREWGIYSSIDDSYESLTKFYFQGNFETLQIPDTEARSLPSAVLYLPL